MSAADDVKYMLLLHMISIFIKDERREGCRASKGLWPRFFFPRRP